MAVPIEKKEGGAIARFSFPEDFTGFKGHFPTGSVVPGVCKVQTVVILAEILNDKKFELEEIKEAKFFSPVTPNEELIFDYSENIMDSRYGRAETQAGQPLDQNSRSTTRPRKSDSRTIESSRLGRANWGARAPT